MTTNRLTNSQIDTEWFSLLVLRGLCSEAAAVEARHRHRLRAIKEAHDRLHRKTRPRKPRGEEGDQCAS